MYDGHAQAQITDSAYYIAQNLKKKDPEIHVRNQIKMRNFKMRNFIFGINRMNKLDYMLCYDDME